MRILLLIMVVPSTLFTHVFAGAHDEEEPPVKCGLPVVAEASAEAQSRHGSAQLLFQRQPRQKSILAGNFRVHYDSTGNNAPVLYDEFHQPIPGSADEFADSTLAIANAVWNVQVNEMMYTAPPSDGGEGGGPEYDIYITDLGLTYGVTYTEQALDNKPDGGRFTSYIVIDNDFSFVTPLQNRGIPAIQVTLAHEFSHALQIGGYGFWQEHVYYYEIVSTWMEDVVFPDVNDYLGYLPGAWGHFENPDLPFSESTPVMYSRAIWGHFVAKRFGPGAIRRSWELILSDDISPLLAIDRSLREPPYGSDLRSAFTEWTLWNHFTGGRHNDEYYPEGAAYPLMTEPAAAFQPPEGQVEGMLSPLAARYHTITGGSSPLVLVSTNANTDAAFSGTLDAEAYAYTLQSFSGAGDFHPTLAGIYVHEQFPDSRNWSTWTVVDGIAGRLTDPLPDLPASLPFPNPFLADGTVQINLPVSSEPSGDVALSVYSADMDLVHSIRGIPTEERGLRVLQWDGRDMTGDIAPSGVYFYVWEAGGRVDKGKFVLIRR